MNGSTPLNSRDNEVAHTSIHVDDRTLTVIKINEIMRQIKKYKAAVLDRIPAETLNKIFHVFFIMI